MEETNKLYIVYEETDGLNDHGRYMYFVGKDADTVEEALFNAGKRGALSCHFTVENKTYWLRTDKYLYWYTA